MVPGSNWRRRDRVPGSAAELPEPGGSLPVAEKDRHGGQALRASPEPVRAQQVPRHSEDLAHVQSAKLGRRRSHQT